MYTDQSPPIPEQEKTGASPASSFNVTSEDLVQPTYIDKNIGKTHETSEKIETRLTKEFKLGGETVPRARYEVKVPIRVTGSALRHIVEEIAGGLNVQTQTRGTEEFQLNVSPVLKYGPHGIPLAPVKPTEYGELMILVNDPNYNTTQNSPRSTVEGVSPQFEGYTRWIRPNQDYTSIVVINTFNFGKTELGEDYNPLTAREEVEKVAYAIAAQQEKRSPHVETVTSITG